MTALGWIFLVYITGSVALHYGFYRLGRLDERRSWLRRRRGGEP